MKPENVYILSPLQEGILFHSLYAPGEGLYTDQFLTKIRGAVSVTVFEKAWERVFDRHPVLRTSFVWEKLEKPVQVVRPKVRPPMEVHDWRALPADARERRLQELLDMDRRRGFDLTTAPLVRLTLVWLEDELFYLLWTYHHILMDAWSGAIVFGEVFAFYESERRGAALELPPALPYQHHIAWLRRQDKAAAEAFWRRELAGFSAPLALALEPPPAGSAGGHRTFETDLSEAKTSEILAAVRGNRLTLNTLVQGLWALLLSRYGSTEDVLFGFVVAGRSSALPAIETAVGLYINTLPARVRVAGNGSILAFLKSLQAHQVEVRQHEHVQLAELQAWSQVPRGKPLFETLLAFQNLPEASGDLHLSLELQESHYLTRTNYPLTLVVTPGVRLRFELTYDAGRYDPTEVERLGERLASLLMAVSSRLDEPVWQMPMLSPEEQRQVLQEWSGASRWQARTGDAPCLHQRLAEQVRRAPDAVAVSCEGVELTYGELARSARRLAHRLRALRVGPDVIVALCAERSPELVVGVLGILEAGGAYLPLDPTYPPDRLAFLLEDSGARALVAAGPLPQELEHWALPKVHLGDVLSGDTGEDPGPLSGPEPCGGNLAYVIYTSGSTGRPKGVLVPHGNAVRLLERTRDLFAFDDRDVWTLFHSYAFDFSVWELWGALLHGGRLVVVSHATSRSPEAFRDLLARERVTVLNQTPSSCYALIEADTEPASPALALRWIIFGGEALEPRRLRDGFRRLGSLSTRWVNMYGITETTVHVTWREVTEADAERRGSPVGGPIPGWECYLLDTHLQPVAPGIPGEIHVGGEGLARGYLGRPDLTAERFVPHPFGRPGERLYRSGDVARHLPDGGLDYLGRADHQVKIRGFRIEPAEIAAALCRCPGVRDAVVVVREDRPGERRLVAYYLPVVEPPPTAASLRETLRRSLPDYMVPAAYIALEKFPLTENGKLDRQALPAPESGPVAGRVLPQGPIEETLVGLWEEVLGQERVGAEDDFFALGGHSLLATRLISRLRRSFRVDVPLAALFERPTPRSLAARIEAALRVGGAAETPLERAPREGPLPLSFAQERLWFLDQLEPGSSVYNVPAALRLIGPLDPAVLAWSLGEVMRRHEALRTTFPAQEGLPLQVIVEHLEIPLPHVDLRALPVPVREAEIRRLAADDANRPFDLALGPLLRAHLISLGEDDHGLLLSIHHIVSDGWSLEVLLGELLALSQARRTGKPSPLPELPLQYADYAVWQRRLLTAGRLEPQLDYWRRRLSDPPELLDLPVDRVRQPVRSSRGGARLLEMRAAGTAHALRDLSRKQGATLFMTLLASFGALLTRLTGALDLQVGIPIAGRDRLELEGLIGLFVNTLVIRTDMTGRPRFTELLARVRQEVLEAHAHKDLPFGKLVEELQPERRLGETPLFQTLFALQSAPWGRVESADLSLSPIEAAGETAKFDLSLIVLEREEALTASLQYASDLFDGATAERILGHYASLLQGALADPGRPVAELPLLSSAEREQLLIEWNATGGALRDACIHHLIEAQADRRSEAVALERGGERVTYGELEARANRVARRLRVLGVGPEIRVGIFLPRTPSLAVAVLGVLKAGGAYVGLEPGYPQERLAYLLKDSAARVIVTERELLGALTAPSPSSRMVCLEDLEAGDGGSERLSGTAGPESMAYLIYTSGSTGKPKGSIIEHHSTVSLIRWSRQVFGDEAFSTVLFSSAFSFDLSVFELLVPLALGGRVVLCDNILGLRDLPPEIGVRTLLTVPSAMTELLRLGALPPSVKTVCLAGEALPRRLADDLFATGSVAAVWNLYGPSEYTTFATFAAVPREGKGAPPIGRPLAATRLYVLDREMEPLPVGVAGELYVAGDGLARGYLGRADLTAERFLPAPWGPLGERLYRTGDRVRWRPDGEAEYLGRLDHQVKVRGFRIELGEVETLLEQHPEIGEAIVLVRDDQSGGRQLVAYVVGRDGVSVSAAELRSHLRERLPEHMVPAAVVVLEAIPVTPNGKADRKALAKIAPAWEASMDSGEVATPIEEIVKGIWAEVLGLDRVGTLDSFFDLGGHSLLATQVISRMERTFGIALPLRTLFHAPTVRALTRELEGARAGDRGAAPIRSAPPGERTRLSFAQERLWFLSQLRIGGAEYNIPFAVRLTGSLDLAAFAASVAEVVRRHESLRTVFTEAGDEPVQVIAPPSALPLTILDLSKLPAESRRRVEHSLTTEEVARPFDLRRGPLFRLMLLRTGTAEHMAVLTMHHIISDGWSMGVFFREVAALYRAILERAPSPLPELRIQYGDFAAWQRRRLSGEELERQLGYWARQLRGELEPLALPTDRPRPPVPSFRGRRQVLTLPPALAEKIAALSRREGVTLFMTLLAAFQTLLYRATGQTDLRIGSAVAGRTLPETEGLIGFFVNMLVLRVDLAGNPTFRELLERVRNVALEAYAHQELPLEQIVDELQPAREAGRTPFFQIAFGVQNAPLDAQELPGLSLEVVDLEAEAARFDLTVWAFERPEGIALSWTWDIDLFDAETIQRLHARLETLLSGVVENPEGELDSFALLGDEERERKVAQHEASHKRFLAVKARAVGART